MSFTESIKTVFFYKYATFKGRASRSEFWWANLFLIILFIVSAAINETLYLILSLITIIPSMAVAFRRLHDTNRSGWHVIINFILWVITGVLAVLAFFTGLAFITSDPAIFDAAITGQDANFSTLPMEAGLFGASTYAFVVFFIAALIHYIVLIVFWIFKGDESDNRFGSNPLLNQSTEEQAQEVNGQPTKMVLNSLTVKELKDLAAQKGVNILSKDTKAEIIKKLSDDA